MLESSLIHSIIDPKLSSKSGRDGSFLIEYYLGPYKTGYLVAREVDDIVLLETFLFLTMDGTPEGDELRRRLRVSRLDKQELWLDDIRLFLDSDIALDQELVELLSECGCGHLFELRKEAEIECSMSGFSGKMRQYLRIRD